MSANVDAMVRAGIEAYRGGKQSEARKLLEKAIELDDYNEQAWMWLSAVVETEEEKRTCLENVVVINPENEEAKRGLKMLGVDGGSAMPTESASDANPFTDTGLADFGDVDFTADDGDDERYGAPTATSSSSSVYQGSETSAGEYDSWVDNLNLGGSGQEPDAEIDSASPLDSNNIEDMFGLDDGDDVFGTNDPFGSEIQFGNDDIDDSAAFMSGPFGGGDEIDDFDIDSSPDPEPTKQPSASPITSPGAENIGGDDFLGELENADLSGGDFITGDDDFENDGQSDISPDELFALIPDEISATRLPGTKQGVSAGSIIVLVVLVVMNFGAIFFLVSGLG
jgi:hypothetical protein